MSARVYAPFAGRLMPSRRLTCSSSRVYRELNGLRALCAIKTLIIDFFISCLLFLYRFCTLLLVNVNGNKISVAHNKQDEEFKNVAGSTEVLSSKRKIIYIGVKFIGERVPPVMTKSA